MQQEMAYTKDFIVQSTKPLAGAAYNVAKGIVDSFGNPSLPFSSTDTFSIENISALKTSISTAPTESQSNQSVTIIVSEGAIQLDARNKTTKEARQILITALESLDCITSIRTNGG